MTHLLPDKLLCHSTFTIERSCLERAEVASIQVFYSPNQTRKAAEQNCFHGFYLESLWSLEHQNKFSLFDNNKPLKNEFMLIKLANAFDVQVTGKVWETEE